jgi:hypothetical protein
MYSFLLLDKERDLQLKLVDVEAAATAILSCSLLIPPLFLRLFHLVCLDKERDLQLRLVEVEAAATAIFLLLTTDSFSLSSSLSCCCSFRQRA